MSDDVDELFGRKARGSFVDRYAPPLRVATATPNEQQIILSDPYEAFVAAPAGQFSEICVLRRWLEGTNIPTSMTFRNRLLLRSEQVGDTDIRLMLVDCIVQISGVRLREEICQRLMNGQIVSINQFNRRMWPNDSDIHPRVNEIKTLSPEH